MLFLLPLSMPPIHQVDEHIRKLLLALSKSVLDPLDQHADPRPGEERCLVRVAVQAVKVYQAASVAVSLGVQEIEQPITLQDLK